MINSNLSLLDNISQAEERLDSLEEMLGKGLNQPFNNTNSGQRKILFGTQFDQVVPLIHAEVPSAQTGYEIRFGDYSASIIKAQNDYEVIGIIPKFSNIPRQHYFMILKDDTAKTIKVIERIPYEHTTEAYGFLYNNSTIDSLSVGSNIKKESIIKKSTSFDDYGNRMDGVNLVCSYLSTAKTMEDSVWLSESGARKLSTSLIKKVTLMFNENDIPLNLYGKDSRYQSFPDIGEPVSEGILCAIRRVKKEESLFSQSYDRLKDILMSDDKFTVEGTVIDVNIYPNDPEILDSFYNAQLKYYYDENKRFCHEVVNIVDKTMTDNPGYSLDYDLQKLAHNCRRVVQGDKYIKEGKVFSNTVIELTIIEEKHIEIGDKLSDRYGGKGVVSGIVPDSEMMTSDTGEVVDCIINQSTCVNRENPGQLFETSINHCSSRIVKFIESGVLTPEESIEMIIEFLRHISVEEAVALEKYLTCLSSDQLEQFISSIISDGTIFTSIKPLSDNMNIDKIAALYEAFPWIQQSWMKSPIVDSNGNIRYVKSRRPMICGKKYMYRLEQYAEGQFSVTSMSSTNIKNQNTKSKANKNYKALHANTPIMFGDMETTDLQHAGIEFVVANLMLHSVSPDARRLVEEMLTGDPFDVNIELDKESTNRNVEIVNAYLKTKGIKLVFQKVKREPKSLVTFDLVYFEAPVTSQSLVSFIDENEVFDYDEYYDKLYKVEDLKKKSLINQDFVVFGK